MSDDIVKSLLEALTDEQKADLGRSLRAVLAKAELKANKKEDKSGEAVSSKVEVSEDFTIKRNDEQSNTQRKTQVRAKKNKWVDEGEFSDPNFDPEKFEKSPRRRTKPSKKEVECHVCGKSFAMNSNLVYGEYVRCNRCTGR